MGITFSEVERWAGSTELDTQFEQYFAEDPEFDHLIFSHCDYKSLLAFASDRDSAKRIFFVSELVRRLVSCLYSPHGLPYHFSRSDGLIPPDDYKKAELQRVENVYQGCTIVEEMRNSEQEEIKNLGNMVLDFRNDRISPKATTTKLLRLLDYQIEVSFTPDTTRYTVRVCKICEDWFKSWVVAGAETETERCPFCILQIDYPQKNGTNKD